MSAGDRATGPRWYSGVRETVWGLGLSSFHREGDGEKEGGVVVREEGARPVVVRGDGELRFAVAGGCVDAGAVAPWKQEYVSCGTG